MNKTSIPYADFTLSLPKCVREANPLNQCPLDLPSGCLEPVADLAHLLRGVTRLAAGHDIAERCLPTLGYRGDVIPCRRRLIAIRTLVLKQLKQQLLPFKRNGVNGLLALVDRLLPTVAKVRVFVIAPTHDGIVMLPAATIAHSTERAPVFAVNAPCKPECFVISPFSKRWPRSLSHISTRLAVVVDTTPACSVPGKVSDGFPLAAPAAPSKTRHFLLRQFVKRQTEILSLQLAGTVRGLRHWAPPGTTLHRELYQTGGVL